MILSLVVEGFTRGSLTRGVTAPLLGDEDRPPDLVVHFTHIEAEGTARCMTGSACNSIGGTFPPGQFGHYYLARRAVSRGSVTAQPPGWIELRQSRRSLQPTGSAGLLWSSPVIDGSWTRRS